ncbi:MAG: hypothetical protein CMP68_03365 [Flavobacteriales bacterium]|nr:hypothetical protein [Flavobacteriales bacterium]
MFSINFFIQKKLKVLLEKIGKKVRDLIISHNNLIEKNRLLLVENENYKNEVDELKNEIIVLKGRIDEILISKSFQNNGNDNKLAKKKINMFLREIDKCITLLNN